MNHLPDTPQPGEVAPTTAEASPRGDKTTATAPRMYPNVIDLTEPEGMMIDALQVWQRAQTRPNLRQWLEVWDELRFVADLPESEREAYTEGYETQRRAALLAIMYAADSYIEQFYPLAARWQQGETEPTA